MNIMQAITALQQSPKRFEGYHAGWFAQLMEAAQEYVAENRPAVNAPEDTDRLMRPLLYEQPQEFLYVLSLDTKHQVITPNLISKGTVDSNKAHQRDVYRAAIYDNASRLMLVHNHPSGDPTPSNNDILCTTAIVNAGDIIGIGVLDHVIIGDKTQDWRGFVSLREQHPEIRFTPNVLES